MPIVIESARLVDARSTGSGARVVGVGERLADRHLGDARRRATISPGPGLVGLDAVERLGHVQLGHLRRARSSRRRGTSATCWPLRIVPLRDAAEREPADVRRGVEVRDERLQRMALLVRRAPGSRSSEQLEQRLAGPSPSASGVERRPRPALRVAVDDRELDLALVGVEVEEELVDLVDDLLDARVRAVDLVDDEDHGQAAPRAPCAARSASAAAGPRSRRRAAARRRPSSGRARPRRRSRRGRACRRC